MLGSWQALGTAGSGDPDSALASAMSPLCTLRMVDQAALTTPAAGPLEAPPGPPTPLQCQAWLMGGRTRGNSLQPTA